MIFCPESKKREWFIGAALLDIYDPSKIIGVTDEPLLKPEKDYELKGFVPNVAFPSGAVIQGNKLYVYYGSADEFCSIASCGLKDLLESLKS